MKTVYMALLVLITGLTGCEPQENNSVFSNTPLTLRYQTSAEAMFMDIKVEGGVLSYTFFTDTENRCAQWFKSTPCWTPEDLETVEQTLEPVDMENLLSLVDSSGVLLLKGDAFGESNLRRRAYTETLTVNLEGTERVLRYRSTPEAERKPVAFTLVENTLRDYAKRLIAGKP